MQVELGFKFRMFSLKHWGPPTLCLVSLTHLIAQLKHFQKEMQGSHQTMLMQFTVCVGNILGRKLNEV